MGKLKLSLMIAASVLYLAVLSYIDFNASPHASFLVFYFLPVIAIVWFAPKWLTIFMTMASIVLAFSFQVLSPHRLPEVLRPHWYFLVKSIFFVFVVALLLKLKSVSAQIKLQNEELKKFNERKSAFVANVSHELRGPLGLIRESLALILEKMVGEVSPEQKEILEIGKHSSERLIRLTKDLLDLSQIEAGKMKLKEEKIDMGALVEEVSKFYETGISDKGLFLKKEIQPDIGVAIGDRDKLAQVIVNLLSNALKYTSKGGITIRLIGTPQGIRFEITDTGPGIPQESLGKMFDKYERLMTEKQEGTGLGLSIAKEIVELHRGKIWVESEIGKGSSFIFLLPQK